MIGGGEEKRDEDNDKETGDERVKEVGRENEDTVKTAATIYERWVISMDKFKKGHAALHYTALHYTALHCTTLHYTTLHYTTLHYTTLHFHTHYYTPTRHNTMLNCTTLLYNTLLLYTIL